MTPEDNLLLTSLLTDSPRGMEVREWLNGPSPKIGVWLPATRRYDPPDGTGDSLAEALSQAAYHAARKAQR